MAARRGAVGVVETEIPAAHRADVETLWNYHDMRHELRPCDVGIGLGSHDISVAAVAADLFHRGFYPLLVFSGANAPTTVARFPRGEAVHFREYAVAHGVPAAAVLVETQATNTGQNIELTRALLRDNGIQVNSAILLSRPYQQRRAFATSRKLWPELDVVCASSRTGLDEYVRNVGSARTVIEMVVGDTSRIERYAELGYAIRQEFPAPVRAAYARLFEAGYTGRVVG